MPNPLLTLPAPRILLRQVRDTAPWLWPAPPEARPVGSGIAAQADHPLGWWRILHAAKGWNRMRRGDATEHGDYLALCLACHHATVASYVPTDVDSKIRGHLWRLASAPRVLEQLYALLVASLAWDVAPCSRRFLDTPHGRLSGMDGEQLGSLVGAYGVLRSRGLDALADDARTRIDAELQREAAIWDAETDRRRRCLLAAVLTHNVGDVGQGLGYWPADERLEADRARWQKLAQEGPERHGGAFIAAASLYKCGLSAEGHRHYPLRDLRCLRRHPDLLLPIAPLLEDWGATLATHPALEEAERLEVLAGLITGCSKVADQRGYQRAIRGFLDARSDADDLIARLPVACAIRLREPAVERVRALDDAGLLADLGA